MAFTFSREIDLMKVAQPEIWDIRLELLHSRKNMILMVRDGLICFINASGVTALGLAGKSDLLGSDLLEIFSNDYRGLMQVGLPALAEEEMVPLKLLRHDGTEIEVEMWFDQIGLASEGIYIVEARNITEHLRSARALRSREQWLEGIINTVADGIIAVDHCGVVQSFNPAAERIFRFPANEVIGKNIRELVPSPIAEKVASEHGTEWQKLTLLGDNLMGRRKDGDTFPMELSVREMFQGDSVSYAGVVRDITARRRAEERIRYLAQHDTLTSLPNRTLFGDRLEAAISRALRSRDRLAVVFIDLNEFKPINDTYGHGIGDKVLMQVAERLKGSLRKTDTVARVGGDEFVAVLEGINNSDQVHALTKKIMIAVIEPLTIEGITLQVTASLGVCTCPDDASDPKSLVDFADKAMYRAKQHGPRSVCVHPDRIWQETASVERSRKAVGGKSSL